MLARGKPLALPSARACTPTDVQLAAGDAGQGETPGSALCQGLHTNRQLQLQGLLARGKPLALPSARACTPTDSQLQEMLARGKPLALPSARAYTPTDSYSCRSCWPGGNPWLCLLPRPAHQQIVSCKSRKQNSQYLQYLPKITIQK